MPIKDFEIRKNIKIDGVVVDVSSNQASGGIVYSNSESKFISSVGNIPVGVVRMWASGSTSPTVPADYLICDGRQNLIQDDYPALYSVIGDRYTDSPNGSTFGVPCFNTSSFQYPFAVGLDKSNNNPAKITPAIGVDETMSHTHITSANFTVNNTAQQVNPNHSHVSSEQNDDTHGHIFPVTSTGGTTHTHTTSNASTAHPHNLADPGTTAAVTSQATANHSHNAAAPKETHAHNSSQEGHIHNVSGGQSNANVSHNHTFSSTLTSNTVTHSHSVATSGFYFIIKYR